MKMYFVVWNLDAFCKRVFTEIRTACTGGSNVLVHYLPPLALSFHLFLPSHLEAIPGRVGGYSFLTVFISIQSSFIPNILTLYMLGSLPISRTTVKTKLMDIMGCLYSVTWLARRKSTTGMAVKNFLFLVSCTPASICSQNVSFL
eukprot:scaffold126_cov315-Pavlova_lutheri.AAC.2